jgi:hypothetical protein
MKAISDAVMAVIKQMQQNELTESVIYERIAKFAKQHGLRVYYYISPKLWAWNTGRVKKIKRYVDRMYTIFPFETEFYKKYGFIARPTEDLGPGMITYLDL